MDDVHGGFVWGTSARMIDDVKEFLEILDADTRVCIESKFLYAFFSPSQ